MALIAHLATLIELYNRPLFIPAIYVARQAPPDLAGVNNFWKGTGNQARHVSESLVIEKRVQPPD